MRAMSPCLPRPADAGKGSGPEQLACGPRVGGPSVGRRRQTGGVGVDPTKVLRELAASASRADRLAHLAALPDRPADTAAWPDWVPKAVRSALAAAGVREM